MTEEIVFNYRKSCGFPCFGLLSVFAAAFMAVSISACPCAWNWRFAVHWWYWCLILPVSAAALLCFGVSSLLFWFNHIRKKPYIVISGGVIHIDAETDIKADDIASIAEKSFLGCKMLCLEIKNPQDYKFSWRFKADRLFHKKYHAFVCPELVAANQKDVLKEWFAARYPAAK